MVGFCCCCCCCCCFLLLDAAVFDVPWLSLSLLSLSLFLTRSALSYPDQQSNSSDDAVVDFISNLRWPINDDRKQKTSYLELFLLYVIRHGVPAGYGGQTCITITRNFSKLFWETCKAATLKVPAQRIRAIRHSGVLAMATLPGSIAPHGSPNMNVFLSPPFC